MPYFTIDYSKTIIYKIVCNDLTIADSYIGHTTDFTSRKKHHKIICNNEMLKESHNRKVYKFIRENGGWDNFSMIEIEKYPCIDRNGAASRERYWYDNLNSQLNMNFPQRSLNEYIEEKRQYYIDNKDKILEQRIINYIDNKETKKIYQKQNYEKNRLDILAKKKIYGEKNRDKIRERESKEFVCDCGRKICVGAKRAHFKSQFHMRYLEQNTAIAIQ